MVPPLSDELAQLKEQRQPVEMATPDEGEAWHEICVCGHRQDRHTTDIGGEIRHRKEYRGQRSILVEQSSGCLGQARPRGFEDISVEVLPPETEGELPRKVTTYRMTCVCAEFRPVLRVFDPRFKFNQRPAGRLPNGRRNPDPTQHALVKGIRAMHSKHLGMKHIKNADVSDDEKERMAQRLTDDRVQWIEANRRCAAEHCKAQGAGVWPAYVDDRDRSELRCAEHRPS